MNGKAASRSRYRVKQRNSPKSVSYSLCQDRHLKRVLQIHVARLGDVRYNAVLEARHKAMQVGGGTLNDFIIFQRQFHARRADDTRNPLPIPMSQMLLYNDEFIVVVVERNLSPRHVRSETLPAGLADALFCHESRLLAHGRFRFDTLVAASRRPSCSTAYSSGCRPSHMPKI